MITTATELDELEAALWGDTPRLRGRNGAWVNACPLMAVTAIYMLLWLCGLQSPWPT